MKEAPPQRFVTGRAGAFVPVELDRVVEDLLERAPASERERLAELFRRFRALYELELAARLRSLRALYRPFDADAESLPSRALAPPDAAARDHLERELRELLARANFVELSQDDVERALLKTSPHGVEVRVDFSAYERLAFFGRGAASRVEAVRDWRPPFRKRRIETPVYRRLCLFVQLAREPEEEPRSRFRIRRSRARRTESELERGAVYLKLFRDVDASDLEMLVPNTRVRIRLGDKLVLGLTGGGGTIGGVTATLSKLGAAANPGTFAFAIFGLGLVLWRQVSRVFARRTSYMAALAANLYCRSLDNGFGVLTRLAELAGEEECKEAVLALDALLRRGSTGASPEELDHEVEAHVRASYGLEMDFEIADGLAKLRRAGLLRESADGLLLAPGLDEALALVEERVEHEVGRRG